MTPDPAPHGAGGRRRSGAASRRQAATRSTLQALGRGAVPYLLVAPVVRRDRRDPRVSALQARHALVPGVRAPAADPAPRRMDRPRELPLRALGHRCSGTRSCGRSCSPPRTSLLTMVLGTLIALLLLRLSTPVRILLTSGLVLVWSMPAGRRGPGLVLDDELPERHPQLRPHRDARRATTSSTTGTARRSRSSRW